MSRSHPATDLDQEVKTTYPDEDGNDVFEKLEEKIGIYFVEENEILKIVNLRRAVADKLTDKYKLDDYLDLIEEEINFLDIVQELDAVQIPQRSNADTEGLVRNAQREFITCLGSLLGPLADLTRKFLESPSATVAKDVELLTNLAGSILKFYKKPENSNNSKDLIENTQLVHKKMGTYWRPVKSALTALVGVICILVGALGLVPSFGASVALIASGGTLCAASGLALSKPFMSHKAHNANELAKDVSQLMIKAKKLLSYDPKLKEAKEPEQTRGRRYSAI